jgi:hypothetical protein
VIELVFVSYHHLTTCKQTSRRFAPHPSPRQRP